MHRASMGRSPRRSEAGCVHPSQPGKCGDPPGPAPAEAARPLRTGRGPARPDARSARPRRRAREPSGEAPWSSPERAPRIRDGIRDRRGPDRCPAVARLCRLPKTRGGPGPPGFPSAATAGWRLRDLGSPRVAGWLPDLRASLLSPCCRAEGSRARELSPHRSRPVIRMRAGVPLVRWRRRFRNGGRIRPLPSTPSLRTAAGAARFGRWGRNLGLLSLPAAVHFQPTPARGGVQSGLFPSAAPPRP